MMGASSRRILERKQPLLRLDAVDVYYGAHHVLQRVGYEVYAGEIVCLIGGNASGKSTTMKIAVQPV